MIDSLEALLASHPRLVVLTGAGISAASGIPTYRNDRGEWQRSDPIQHGDFIDREASRRRYWARSMAGWSYVAESRPNRAHYALASLEAAGHVDLRWARSVRRTVGDAKRSLCAARRLPGTAAAGPRHAHRG